MSRYFDCSNCGVPVPKNDDVCIGCVSHCSWRCVLERAVAERAVFRHQLEIKLAHNAELIVRAHDHIEAEKARKQRDKS